MVTDEFSELAGVFLHPVKAMVESDKIDRIKKRLRKSNRLSFAGANTGDHAF
jgi:hypothetical protein